MAASNVELEGDDDFQVLSLQFGIPKETLIRIAESSEDNDNLVKRSVLYLKEQSKKDQKWRTEMTNLRRARVNAEQQFNQLEKQLITCNTKLEAETTRNAKLGQELKETAATLADKQKRLQEVEGIKEDASTNYSRVAKLNEQLETEKLELLAMLERKRQEIEGLNEEWKSMSEKLSNANSEKCKAEAKLDEIQSQETSFMFKEKRLMQETELLKKQNDWLNQELKTKTDELCAIRKDKSTQVFDLQSQLDEKEEELKHVERLLEDSNKNQAELESKVESYMEKLKEVRYELVKSDEHYKMELASQSKLADLYKNEASENTKKCKEMLTAMEELQKFLKTTEEARLESESKLKEQEESSETALSELENKITKLENELENANDLLQAARQRGVAPMTSETLSALSPTAAATSSLLKSGMTLTEIYSQYVEVSDSLQQEKDENVRLKNYLDQIMKELEEKAPILQQQRRDYENALHSVDKLTTKLETSLVEHEKLAIESDDARKQCEHLKRENSRLKTLSADLSQQVQVLLKECEEARAGKFSTLDTSSEEVSSSSQVISSHLVTFRNIEELQQQNQRLLAVVRELSEDKEKNEQRGPDNMITDLKDQLSVALKELDHVKDERSRQMNMVEVMVRQRDMYRVLLANTGQSPIPLPADESFLQTRSPSAQDKSLAAVEQTRDALRELQKHFADYKDERKLAEDKLTERLDSLQMENAQLRGEGSKLKSQVEFSGERYKMLQSNVEGFKKEAKAASEKAHQLNLSNTKLQAQLDAQSQELSVLKDKLNKSEVNVVGTLIDEGGIRGKTKVNCENIKAEKAMLRESEVRLLQENKSLLEQQKNQNSLLTNLRSLQNQLERAEFETRTRLENQVEAIQKENTMVKRKLEAEESHHTNIIRKLENQVQELRTQIDTEAKSNRQARDMLVTNTKEMEALQTKYAEANAQLEAAERRLNDLLTKDRDVEKEEADTARKEMEEKYSILLQEAKMNLKESETKVKGLEDQLKKSKTHEDQYKSMSLAHEEALKDLNKTTLELKTSLEARLKKAEDENSYMQGQIQSLESKHNTLLLENSHAKKDAERQISELQEILSTIRHELEEARMKARSACASEQMAREELKEQASIATQCQEKYERELMLHAKDVQALSAAKEKLQGQETKFNEVQDRANAAEEQLKGVNQSWVQEKKQYIIENKKLEARCGDLVNQNSTLHKEFDKLVTQLASATKVSFTQPPSSSSEDLGQEDTKSTVELWEIVKFARREKEIAETKGELAQSESLRYQQRCSFLEKQLADAQKNLKEEKTQTQLDAELSAKHTEVLEKVKKLNELTQANKVLMDERQSLEQRSKAVEAKLKKLESELQTLKESNRTITAAKDSLLGEKSALKNEIMRWTSKTNNLMEQYKNINPDEYKRMVEEKKMFQQQIASQKTENQRTKAQLETMKNNLTAATGELNTLKNEHKKVTEEIENLKSQSKESSAAQNEVEALKKTLAEKTEEIKEKITTLNKVKRIARQYKSQCDEKSKEVAELKKKMEEAPQQAPAEVKEGTSEGVDVSSYENKIKELTDQVTALEDQVKAQKTQDEQNRAQSKEKEDKSKKVLIQAREKIQHLTALKDRLGTENEELKKGVKAASEAKESTIQRNKELDERINLLQSQYDGRVARMEKEMNDLKTKRESEAEDSKKKLEEKKSENEQQQQQIQQLQKQIQQQQQKLASMATAANSVARSLGDSPGQDNTQTLDSTSGIPSTAPVSIVPPTATIKPTSAPAANKSSSAKTASIRPMPITQGTPTPTATVLPTVTSTAQEIPSTVAAVVPSRSQVTITSTASMSATVRPITSGASTSEVPVSSDDASQRTPAEQQAGRMTPSADSSQPSVTVTSSNKRQRDEEEDVDRQSQVQASEPVEKRIRTSEVEAAEEIVDEQVADEGEQEEEGWEVPEMESGRETPEVVLIESGDEDEEDEEEMEEEDEDEEDMEDEDEDDGEEGDEEIEEEGTPAEIDVVEVIDDDEEEEEEEKIPEEQDEEEIGEEEDEEEEDVVEEEEEDEEDKDDNEMSEPDDEQVTTEDIQESGPSQSGVPEDDDVQITQTEVVPVIQQLPSVVVAPGQFEQQQQQQQQEEEPGPVGGTVSIDRPRSHLAPFSFSQGQSAQGPFDEADDCTVPSTPTLFVPKRTDGFAEAISSPHIHRPFNFAPPSEGNNSGMQILGLESSISVGGMRVDDTRVNLMDETSEDITAARSSFSAETTGIQDRTEPSNQTVPERSQSRGSDSAFRQQSLESLESEGDFSTDVTSMTDLPSITVTPASDRSVEETTEQNVPDTQQEAGGPEPEVVLGDDEDDETGDGREEGEGDKEGDLETEAAETVEQTQVDKPSDAKSSEPVAVEGTSSSEAIETRPSTSASSEAKDSSKGRGAVVQLKRPTTTGQEAGQSGIRRGAVHAQGGRARRIKRFIPGRGNTRGRGRGTNGRGGRGTSH